MALLLLLLLDDDEASLLLVLVNRLLVKSVGLSSSSYSATAECPPRVTVTYVSGNKAVEEVADDDALVVVEARGVRRLLLF